MQRFKIYYSDDGTRVAQFSPLVSPVYEVDPETGLPRVLEEGDYFKVATAGIAHWVEVRYIRKRAWWFDKQLGRGIICAAAQDTITAHDILWAALDALESWEKKKAEAEHKAAEKQKQKQQPREKSVKVKPTPPVKVKPVDNSGWFGKYPPKSLKEL